MGKTRMERRQWWMDTLSVLGICALFGLVFLAGFATCYAMQAAAW